MTGPGQVNLRVRLASKAERLERPHAVQGRVQLLVDKDYVHVRPRVRPGLLGNSEVGLEDPWCEQRREPGRRPWYPLRHPSRGEETQTWQPDCTQNVQRQALLQLLLRVSTGFSLRVA